MSLTPSLLNTEIPVTFCSFYVVIFVPKKNGIPGVPRLSHIFLDILRPFYSDTFFLQPYAYCTVCRIIHSHSLSNKPSDANARRGADVGVKLKQRKCL